jgi:hypothetical protein
MTDTKIPGWIYTHDRNNTVRYLLGTTGLNPLICIGINPSTAAPNALDNTLKSVERLSLYHGHDSWIMLNVYPQRATNPNDMHLECDSEIHKRNLESIEKLIHGIPNPCFWAAWGTLIEKRPYLLTCLNDIYRLTQLSTSSWVSMGKNSAKGHPHHPLYLSKTSTKHDFDIKGYVSQHLSMGS